MDYEVRSSDDEKEQAPPRGYPTYDNEIAVVQASIGFACLFYVFFHNNKPIP